MCNMKNQTPKDLRNRWKKRGPSKNEKKETDRERQAERQEEGIG